MEAVVVLAILTRTAWCSSMTMTNDARAFNIQFFLLLFDSLPVAMEHQFEPCRIRSLTLCYYTIKSRDSFLVAVPIVACGGRGTSSRTIV